MFYNKDIFNRCFYHKSRYWYKNIAKIPLYFKLIHHLVKYGYDEYATWETFDWFITIMKSLLKRYRDNHCGYPVASYEDKDLQDFSNKEYDSDLDKMISLLDNMDENNPKYKNVEYSNKNAEMNKAKDEFFALFAKHFYSLWD